MGTIQEFDDSFLNVWSDDDEGPFEVTREQIIQYALATNDPIPAHQSGDTAPPVFGIVPVFNAMLMPCIDVVPIEIFGRAVHGEQDFHFHRPLMPGDRLTSRSTMTGYETLPTGTRASIHIECRDQHDELVNEQYVTVFFRNVDAGRSVGHLSPTHSLVESVRAQDPVAVVHQHIDADQTFRYGPAAGDPMPIHLDDDVARNAGLPGIIAHGLCVMAFTSWAILTEVGLSDTSRMRRLAVRFNRMVLPDSDLTTTIWAGPKGDGYSTFAFESTVGGDIAIRDGLAEIWD